MKTKLMIGILLLVSSALLAQQYPQQLTLSHSESNPGEQKAIETITASNALRTGARARYMAGKSVTLQPGFAAQAGSVFAASIATLVSSSPANDIPGLSIRAYPNPFIEQTTIEYSLPLEGRVRHTLLDAQGRVVQQSEDPQEQAVGTHQAPFRMGNLPAGIYLYRLQLGVQSRTLRLLKKP